MVINMTKRSSNRTVIFVGTMVKVFFLVFIVYCFAYRVLAATNRDTSEKRFTEVIVKKGDTLWGMAEKLGSDEDIRKTVYEIRKLNNLSTVKIVPGQVVRIPVFSE